MTFGLIFNFVFSFQIWPGIYLDMFVWLLGAQRRAQLHYLICGLIKNGMFQNVISFESLIELPIVLPIDCGVLIAVWIIHLPSAFPPPCLTTCVVFGIVTTVSNHGTVAGRPKASGYRSRLISRKKSLRDELSVPPNQPVRVFVFMLRRGLR